MSQQLINIGQTANTSNADTLRAAFSKINANFTELYNSITGLGSIVFNVQDFGAKGDGINDDYIAFQNAINAAFQVRGVVAVPATNARYLISDYLRIPSNVTIMAAPTATISRMDNTIKLDQPLLASNSDHITGNSFISIFGGIWDGNAANNPRDPRALNGSPEQLNFVLQTLFAFDKVEGLTLDKVVMLNPVVYNIRIQESINGYIGNIEFRVTEPKEFGAGVQFQGLCHNWRIDHLWGHCTDDMLALNASDGFAGNPGPTIQGPISDFSVGTIDVGPAGFEAVRFLSARGNFIHRINIEHITGAVGYAGVNAGRFALPGNSFVDDIHIGRMNCWKINAGGLSDPNVPLIMLEDVNIGNFVVDSYSQGPSTIPVPDLELRPNSTARSIVFNSFQSNYSGGTRGASIFAIDTVIINLTVNGIDSLASQPGSFFLAQNCVIASLNLNNGVLEGWDKIVTSAAVPFTMQALSFTNIEIRDGIDGILALTGNVWNRINLNNVISTTNTGSLLESQTGASLSFVDMASVQWSNAESIVHIASGQVSRVAVTATSTSGTGNSQGNFDNDDPTNASVTNIALTADFGVPGSITTVASPTFDLVQKVPLFSSAQNMRYSSTWTDGISQYKVWYWGMSLTTAGDSSWAMSYISSSGPNLPDAFKVDTSGNLFAKGDFVPATGHGLVSGTGSGNTALLRAYDVDGAVYVTFGTLTSGNTPTFDLSSSTTINGSPLLAAGPITTSNLTMSTARLLGRTTAGTGAVEEITPGTSLSFAAGTLNTIQDIRTSASPTFVAITSTVATGTSPFTVASTTVVPNLNVSQLLGGTWAIPGTIGSTTPNTAAFTTVTATTLTITGTSGSIFTRGPSASVNTPQTVLILGATSSGDVTNGYGPELMFRWTDTGASNVSCGSVSFIRTTDDNTSDFVIQVRSGGALAERWRIQGAGNFIATTDNTYDIGASGANRPRNIYAGNDVVVSGNVNPIGGILGKTNGSNADAGDVGEFVSSAVAIGSAVALSNATTTNITSIPLTAGDWDIEGNVNYNATGATTTGMISGISGTSATMPSDGSEVYNGMQAMLLNFVAGSALPRKRINITSPTTVYLVARPTFSAGTMSAFGSITARRPR